MNDQAVYRTAPAAPGLLNIFKTKTYSQGFSSLRFGEYSTCGRIHAKGPRKKVNVKKWIFSY